MTMRRHRLLILLALFAGTSVWAVAEPADDEQEVYRRTLEALRKHPEHLKKLRENWTSFNATSEKRKDAIVKLDKELDKLTGKKKERLWNALTRYTDWLEDLRKTDRPAYEAIKAADAEGKLRLIKDRRLREWMETQPKKYRDEWDKLKDAAARVEYVLKRREAERVKQNQWVIAKRFWTELESKQPMPSKLNDFAVKEKGKGGAENNKVKDYVNDYLMPYLSEDQKKQLADAEGRWPEYPQTLVEIARRRPSALPPKDANQKVKMPLFLSELPKPVLAQLKDSKKKKKLLLIQELQQFEKREDFARKVVEIGTNKGSAPFDHEFWACSKKGLHEPMKKFVDNSLTPKLNKAESDRLSDSEQRWPAYPETIQDLARKYGLQPPWHYLPEAEVWKWDLYRTPRATGW